MDTSHPTTSGAETDGWHGPAPAGLFAPGHRIEHPGGGVVVVELVGEHDLATSDTIRRLFLKLVETNRLLVVDLSETTFIDSTFLRTLVTAHKQALAIGSRLRLQVGDAPSVRRVLESTDLARYFDCVNDRDEALR